MYQYQADEYPTQELTYPRQRTNRTRLVAGGLFVAALMLLLVAVVACRGAEDRDPAAAGASPGINVAESGSPAPSAEPSEPASGGNAEGGNPGAGGGGNPGPGGGGNPGPGGGGNPEPGEDPEPPAPDPLQITASVSAPSPAPGCAARGTITVAGGEYPMDITYLWFRMQSLGGGQPPVPLPYGEQLTSTVDEPGQVAVQSPDFPATAPQNQLQLRVLAPAAAATGFVTYPKCAEFGLSH